MDQHLEVDWNAFKRGLEVPIYVVLLYLMQWLR